MSLRSRRTLSGLSLLEMIIALALTATVAASFATIFKASASYVQVSNSKTEAWDKQQIVEKRLVQLVQGAYLSPNPADTLTNFIATTNGGAGNPDTLEFTTLGRPIEAAALDVSDDKDFQTRNQTYGPQGGVTEASLSTTAVGSGAQGSGLFLRMQQPADGDITQGGNEELLWDGVKSVSFEFWDGLEWATTWDTTTGPRRLPAAVRITLGDDTSDTAHVITVPIDMSDVTSSNPVSMATQ